MKDNSLNAALRIMANISAWIAFPVIIGLYLGKWLDNKFGTDPWLFLITIAFCFLVSVYGLVVSARQEFKKVEKEYRLESTAKSSDGPKNKNIS